MDDEIYERILVRPLFRPFAEQLIERLAPTPGDSVIDVACGTGVVARAARERQGDRPIDWRLGNATNLQATADEHFTVVACHQGMQVIPDKAAAIREIGMSDKGKSMSEAERGELAGQVAAESRDLIARGTHEGMLVLPLASIVATAHG